MVLGVDTGGTFTDIVALGDDGEIVVRKCQSIPKDPAAAIVHAFEMVGPPSGFSLVHGTTVATNALLERRGAKTALITTQGCRDVLEIGRQTRTELYSLSPSPRNPLIPRSLRFEVPERLDWQAEVVTALDIVAVENVLDSLKVDEVESLAVCFLFSFLRPEHELAVGQLARAKGLFVSLSSEIAPEFREYERTATVCANSFVGPVMTGYIDRLSRKLGDLGADNLAIMQSNGGTLRAEEAGSVAVKTVLSGPVGGVIAATRVAKSAGLTRVITFDMGGTSTDVALIDGKPLSVRTGEVAGIPLLTPMLDIHTVGAGGGSIARIDAGGAVRVGPKSAGADPGPVAYGVGEELTVTDANVLLGRLPEEVRLAGSMALNSERVRGRFAQFADRLSVTPHEAAEGIVGIVNANMARAIRHISTERGHDPVDYTLVSFGGAGGLHACELAEMLRIPRILVPLCPGAFSALGLALADSKREAVRSVFVSIDATGEAKVTEASFELTEIVTKDLDVNTSRLRKIKLERFLEIRYVGQSYALRVDFCTNLTSTAKAFHRAHKRRYGYADVRAEVEVVAVGVSGTAVKRSPPQFRFNLPAVQASQIGSAPIFYHGRQLIAGMYRRVDFAAGQSLTGPAIVLQDDATTFIPPEWAMQVDSLGNLILISGNDIS